MQFFSVQRGSSAVVFLLSIWGGAAMLAEVTSLKTEPIHNYDAQNSSKKYWQIYFLNTKSVTDRKCISTDLHRSQLQPGPRRVQLSGADECDVHTQGSVHGGAVNTQEHSIRDTRPGWVTGTTVKALLKEKIIASKFKSKASVTQGISCLVWTHTTISHWKKSFQ